MVMGQLQDYFSKVLRSFINFVGIILAAETGAGGRPGKEGKHWNSLILAFKF